MLHDVMVSHSITLEQNRHQQQEKAAQKAAEEQEQKEKFEKFATQWPQASMMVFSREIEVRCHTVTKALLSKNSESASQAYQKVVRGQMLTKLEEKTHELK
eukprot:3361843-Karenia_brevis.AAC.1